MLFLTGCAHRPETPAITVAPIPTYGEETADRILVSIHGVGIARPGRYWITSGTTVVGAIEQAGDILPGADQHVIVTRSYKYPETHGVTKFSFKLRDPRERKLAEEFRMQSGDSLLVGLENG